MIRKYTNRDTLYTIPDVNIPLYWIRPQEILSAGPGSHRFLWDMHYTPLNIPPSYTISATSRNTAPNETAPWVLPGRFIARLTVDGKAYKQSFEVKMDPRVLTSDEELEAIRNLAYICYDGRKRCMDILAQIKTYRNKIKELGAKASNNLAAKLKETDEHLDLLENSRPGNPDRGFKRMNNDLATLFNIINESDLRMTSQTTDAAVKAKMDLELLLIKWNEVSRKEIPELNQLLKKEKLGEL